MSNNTHYDILGIKKDATQTEINKARKMLALKLHPDKCPNGETLMKMINEAYEVLSDEKQRRAYDRKLGSGNGSPSKKQQYQSRQEQSHSSSGGGDHGGYSRQQYSSGGGGWSNSRAGASDSGGSSYHSQWGQWSQGKQYSSYKSKENGYGSWQSEPEPHVEFLCLICKEIVKGNDFWRTSCCHKLCCAECLGIDVPAPYCKDRKNCPGFSCGKPLVVRAGTLIDGWVRGSKVTLKQLEAIAPAHECGRHILPKDLESHLTRCPSLNTECFRCSGKGSYPSMFGWNTKCVACAGEKYLQGLEWTKCFACLGVGCNSCEEKGAIKGLWSMCHRCAGKGSTTEHGRPGIFQAPFESTVKVDGNAHITLQSITGMQQYEHLSFEELRLSDYMSGNRGMGSIINGCTACCRKGRLEGAWTVCFRCEGCGSRMDGGQQVNCNSCAGVGSVRGYNLQPCSSCMGDGCQSCQWKGSEKCSCGPSCKGHQSDL